MNPERRGGLLGAVNIAQSSAVITLKCSLAINTLKKDYGKNVQKTQKSFFLHNSQENERKQKKRKPQNTMKCSRRGRALHFLSTFQPVITLLFVNSTIQELRRKKEKKKEQKHKVQQLIQMSTTSERRSRKKKGRKETINEVIIRTSW